jgi:acyl-CoA synthetase (AMP-forming)/AMP-acid ligase II
MMMSTIAGSRNALLPTLTQAINEHATVHPQRVAIEDEYRSLSWQVLLTECCEMTRLLQARQVKRLGISAGNEAGHLVALVAAAAAQIPAVPVAPEWTAQDIGRRFAASAVDFVLCSEGDEERMRSVTQVLVEALPRHSVAPTVSGSQSAQLPRKDEPEMLPPGDFDALHLIASTGGTSGKLKFAHLTHGNTVARFIAQVAEFGLRRRGRFLCMTPLFHGGGRSFCLSHLYFGGTVVLRERFAPHAWLRDVRGCTASFIVPTMASRLVDVATLRLDDGVVVVISGAKLDARLVARWQERIGGRVFNYYGSVEAGAMAVASAQEMLQTDDPDCIGMAAFGVHIEFQETGEAALAGAAAGSPVLVSGPGVAVAIETEGSAAIACGHVNPGDLLCREASGYLQYKGRADDVLITGGVNVYPTLVEDAFRQCAAVSQVALVGVPHPEWGQELVLGVVPSAGQALDEADLRSFAKDQLARYAQPKRYLIMREFPLTTAGKVDRRALMDMARKSPW